MVMKIYLVGGALRDEMLGRLVAEKDWCVVGATVDEMLAQGFKPVGKDFPVFLHPETGEEYALARTERKSGQGYHGFTFHTSPDVTIEDDLRRRDLTINAMARLEGDDVLVDPYGGQSDLQAKVLRHVSEAFVEDPVRVLRLARFAAVLPAFSLADETQHLLQTMVQSGELEHLVAERVWQELAKALVAEAPQRFFAVLLESGALGVLMPELEGISEDLIAYAERVSQHLSDVDGRFAALWGRCASDDLAAIAQRVRVPVSAMDLAQMVSKHGDKVKDLDGMSAEDLLATFESLDIFRREARFWQWLDVVQVLHDVRVDVDRLQKSFAACQQVDVSALQAQGFSGADLGQAIREQRVERIKAETP